MKIEILKEIAKIIRGLSIDGIEAAKSGHPGLPLGCAEIAAYLYGEALIHDPSNPNWLNRDKFILSAGHGSMLLYSALHLAGFNCSIDDLKQFRQLHAKTAGHPEKGLLEGVETTTGPLGQGLATAVGMAAANKIIQSHYHLENLISGKVVVLAGDGCMMEGVASEAASLAGHLKLSNLIVFYDSNDISLDGPLDESMSENTYERFKSYGWDCVQIDGHDFEQIHGAYEAAKESEKPFLIVAKTVIGQGAVKGAGTAEVHGKPLGSDVAKETKRALGLNHEQSFFVSEECRDYFKNKRDAQKLIFLHWNEQFSLWKKENPELANKLQIAKDQQISENQIQKIKQQECKPSLATRASSNAIIQTIHETFSYIIGGSADLSCSDSTFIKNSKSVTAKDFSGHNIKYGAREFAMATFASGLALSEILRPFIGTFLMFSDYMKNGIRLAALMKLPVIYQFTHDSIFLGEDGPTHQPIEQLASLRSIPNLSVIRPADTKEVKGAWILALKNKNRPTALILSRQSAPDLENTSIDAVEKGAYIVKQSQSPDVILIATGTEVALSLDIAQKLEFKKITVRIISMPSQDQFDQQDQAYKDSLFDHDSALFVSIEAQSEMGWHKYIGKDGLAISINQFGESAKASDLQSFFKFNAEDISQKIEEKIKIKSLSS